MGIWSKVKNIASNVKAAVTNKVSSYFQPKKTATSQVTPQQTQNYDISKPTYTNPFTKETGNTQTSVSNRDYSSAPNLSTSSNNMPVNQSNPFTAPTENMSMPTNNMSMPPMQQGEAPNSFIDRAKAWITDLENKNNAKIGQSAFSQVMPNALNPLQPTGIDEQGNPIKPTLTTGDIAQAGAIGSASTGLGVVNSIKSLSSIWDARNAASVARVSKTFSLDEATSTQLLKQTSSWSKVKGIITKITPKSLAGKITLGGVASGAILSVPGLDTLTQWAALDNVIGGSSMYSANLLKGVQGGSIDPLKAQEMLADQQKTMDIAISKIETSNKYNPTMWIFRKLIMAGVDTGQANFDLNKQQIDAAAEQAKANGGKVPTFAETQAATKQAAREQELQWQAEDDARSKAINEAIIAAREAKQADEMENLKEVQRLLEQGIRDREELKASYEQQQSYSYSSTNYEDKYQEFLKEQEYLMLQWQKKLDETSKSSLSFGLLK